MKYPEPTARNSAHQSQARIVERLGNLRKRGREWVGPCPACGDGDDRFRVTPDGRVYCRQCCPDGRNIAAVEQLLRAVGEWTTERRPAPNGQRKWRCSGPDGSRVHVRTDSDVGKKFTWAGDGPGAAGLLYVARSAPGSRLIVTEGQRAADAVRDAIADVSVTSTCEAVPDVETIRHHLKAMRPGSVSIWPDNDDPALSRRSNRGSARRSGRSGSTRAPSARAPRSVPLRSSSRPRGGVPGRCAASGGVFGGFASLGRAWGPVGPWRGVSGRPGGVPGPSVAGRFRSAGAGAFRSFAWVDPSSAGGEGSKRWLVRAVTFRISVSPPTSS